MTALEKVLRLRPSSVAARLAATKTCLLNPRDLMRSVHGTTVVVFECLATPIAAGVLRAARQRDAVVGLSFPALPLGEAPRPVAAARTLMDVAVQAGHELPFFLRAGPVAVPAATPDAAAQAREVVFRFVDAGFTEVCLELGALGAAGAAAVLAEASAALRERELSVEVTTRETDPERLAELLAGLGSGGVRVDVVTIPGSALAGVADLSPLVEAALPAGLAVVDPREGTSMEGAQRRVASGRFTRLALNALTEEAQAAVRERARSAAGWSVPGALAAAARAAALDPVSLLKMEAQAYHEAFLLLEASQGSAAASVLFLSQHVAD